jgi:hypothetical protein
MDNVFMTKNRWLFLIALAFLLFVARFGGGGEEGRNSVRPPNVILKAAPGNTIVQMFETVGEGPNDEITEFRDGTICTKYSEPRTVSIDGISMSFYQLQCNGKMGYANSRWVRD